MTMSITRNFSVVPVLVIEDSTWASDLGSCLVESGLPIVEVTLRTPQSWEALTEMKKVKGLTVGLGSVSKVSDLERGRDLGVDFAVSAGIRRDLVEKSQTLGIEYFPGVATPSEILTALDCQLQILKWFPAETLGGITALKAISAPFPQLKFVPTGGINGENAQEYLRESNVVAVGGSWMFSKEALASKNLQLISEKARAASTLSKGRK
jgi:2-dehydro-3-deoxyphosphogluconate aldolase/(4S)-4-hydroxy-2-oxoglutarate aldolase